MIYRNDLPKSNDLQESVAGILASLAELTKKSTNFEELREMIPLQSDLKKTENHNREMNNILGVMEKALSEVKSNYGSTSRAVSTCTSTLDRMVSQITVETSKLQESLKKVQGEYVSLEGKLKEMISLESQQVERQIKLVRDSNHRKIKDFISRQQNQLCLSASIGSNPYKIAMLRRRIQQNPQINNNYKECQALLGEISCLRAHSTIKSRQYQASADFYDQINKFINQAQNHFQRDYPFLVSKLKEFQQSVDLSPYEQGIFHQCYAWGTRLKVSLEAAIIKLSMALRQTLQISETQAEVEAWQQTLERWEGMRSALSTLLQ